MSRAESATREWWALALLSVIVGITAVVRLRLLDLPLDRDEGEYAYIAQLLLDGVPPYAGAYTMKMPGISAVYAIILSVFGKTPAAIHLGVLVASAASTVLVFVLARRLAGAGAAVAAAATFASVSVSPVFLGASGYAEHFVVLAALAGTMRLLTALDGRRLMPFVESGALFGLAFVVKQSGGVFAIFAVLYPMLIRRSDGPGVARRLGIVACVTAGAVFPALTIAALLLGAGSFDRFVFWSFTYASRYASAVSWEDGLGHLVDRLAEVMPVMAFVFAWAVVGVVLAAGDRSLRTTRTFVLLFLLVSGIAVSVGLYFRYQYFLLLAPAIAFCGGLVPAAMYRSLSPRAPRLALAFAIVLTLVPPAHAMYAERARLFHRSSHAASAMASEQHPFPESVEIGRYIREHTEPGATVAVIGSEPQIYFYAGRRAATGYIYMYPLMEGHPYARAMQTELMAEVEAERPEVLVFVNMSASWLRRAGSSPLVFQWFEQYRRGFDQVGLIELPSPGSPLYAWGPDSAARAPRTAEWITVFRRKAPPFVENADRG